MRSCLRTRAYVARRIAEGETTRGIRRCLKRYIACELGALRLSGRTDVTEATRWASRSMDRPFAILGLTS